MLFKINCYLGHCFFNTLSIENLQISHDTYYGYSGFIFYIDIHIQLDIGENSLARD